MKRILFVCCLLVFTCTMPFMQQATAQMPVVTTASFTAKANQLDAYIAAGNLTQANITADDINQTMMIVVTKSKNDLNRATTPTDITHYTTVNTNQNTLYSAFWTLRSNLTANRTVIHTKLLAFAALVY
jgi:hypothetical protein